MFWGLVLRANKRYSQTVSKTFHLSQATLDVSQAGDADSVQVTLTSDNENYILCTLSKKKDVLQVPLDLVFSEGDEISFSANGVVHLTGYLIPNDEFDGFGGEGEDDDEELDEEEQDDEAPELVPAKKLSKKQLELKKLLEAELDGEEDEEDSDFDGEEGDEEAGEGEEDDDEEDDDEDDDDEEDDDDDDEEEEEIAEPVAKKQKQLNGSANGKAEKAQPQQQAQKKQQQQPEKAEPKVKTLQGGVQIEDLRLGKGAEAKPGKKVQVYYEGRLKTNNKVFDSSKSGSGFSFNLGRGEVIRGWDLGVAGMKIGAKRRITCPPAMAYGAKGSPPVIPANATLVFDVELRNIK